MSGRGKSRKGQQGSGGGRGTGQGTNTPASTTSAPRGPRPPQQFVASPATTGSAWGPKPSGMSATQHFDASPAPIGSAWGPTPSGRSATEQFVSAPAPIVSVWGQKPTQTVPSQSAVVQSQSKQPQPARSQPQLQPQSAWGKPSPQSAWGKPSPQSAWRQPQHQPQSATASGGNGSIATTPQATHQNQSQQRSGREQPQRGQPPKQASSTSRGAEARGGGVVDRVARGAGEVDRGATRGKREIKDIIRTKPANMNSKCGSSGVKVPLITNYYKLTNKPNWQLYQYRVDFSPDDVSEGKKKFIMKQQQKNLKFGGYLFDGTMLFLTVKLQNDCTEIMSKDLEDNAIQTKVKFIKLLSMTTAQSLQVLNLIQRKSMNALNLQLVGRNFFDPSALIDIPNHRLQLWPGYVTSIRQHERDILLCAEITTKVMRNQTVLDILNDCYKRNRNEFKKLFENDVVGMIVYTSYNNKSYRIDDVDWVKNPRNTFLQKENEISFVKYYQSKHNLTIRDMAQPLLISKASDRDLRGGEAKLLALIPELCRPTGLNVDMRGNFHLMRDIAQYTRLTPAARLQRLRNFNSRLQQNPGSRQNFEEWNFALDRDLVQVTGRCLPNEKIYFGNSKQVPTGSTADWSREFRNIAMYNSQHLTNWVIIYAQQNKNTVEAFISQMKRAASGMSYRMSDPRHISIADDNTRTYSKALDEAANVNPQLIMCIVSNQNSDRYSVIKKKCCLERAIPTQVMVIRTITPKFGKDAGSLLTVGTKVVIQMNSKLGGAPWMVDIPLQGVMVIGFDVFHDTINKQKSYGAMVATMDMKLKQNYFSAVSAHETGNELSNNFALNIVKAVSAFVRQHGEPPKKILIYRDGVGEGQTDYVYEHEIKVILAALESAYNGGPVNMTFVVVSKRINTRFFKDPNNPQNPNPGTVVDDGVTLPERYDFFLVSQSVNQGTVSPTNYNVLHDGMHLQPDRLQVLTYKMTHLYYNWTGTLRVPAVCQYAHKLAFLVGNYLHESPSSLLEKQLYFL